jgi:hypothetical protein
VKRRPGCNLPAGSRLLAQVFDSRHLCSLCLFESDTLMWRGRGVGYYTASEGNRRDGQAFGLGVEGA